MDPPQGRLSDRDPHVAKRRCELVGVRVVTRSPGFIRRGVPARRFLRPVGRDVDPESRTLRTLDPGQGT